MRQIDESHFAPHSVEKLNVSYQHAKKKKVESITQRCVCLMYPFVMGFHLFNEFFLSMNSFIFAFHLLH
jgi:hypothetical protein